MPKIIVTPGDEHGRWTVVKEVEPRIMPSGRQRMVECLCDCGNIRIVALGSLRSNVSVSCGCTNRERLGNTSRTHGKTDHPLHVVWGSMKDRCYNENCKAYHNYGGRGVTVCDEWKNDFQAFYDWAMANGWEPGIEIDRENNNGDYNPGNCRFVTGKENCRNTRRNLLLKLGGVIQCAEAWAEQLGIDGKTLRARKSYGWSDEKALTEPVKNVKPYRNGLTLNGETKSMAEWSRITGLSYTALNSRLHSGWSDEKTLTTPVTPSVHILPHNGETLSIVEWARRMGVEPTLLYGRIRRGWSDERTLTTPVTTKPKPLK